MRAIVCERLGDPDHLVLRDVPSPTPGPGEVKVALRARGVSFVDVLVIAGQYQTQREVPFIPGGEAAGVVVEVGSGVQHIAPGDRVLVPGGYADEAVAPAARVTSLPATVSFETAAAFRSNYATAYYGLQRGRLSAGEVPLVHGAAGGVGLAAVDVGKLLGVTVIATASTKEKLAVCRQMGADHAINYTPGLPRRGKGFHRRSRRRRDLRPGGWRRVRRIDALHRPLRPPAHRRLHERPSRPAQGNHLLIKNAEAIGFTIGALSRLDPARERKNLATLMTWLAAGRITPHVSHRLPLEQAA